MIYIGHSDPADLFGGKTPDRAFWNAQIHATYANTNHLWEIISARNACLFHRIGYIIMRAIYNAL